VLKPGLLGLKVGDRGLDGIPGQHRTMNFQGRQGERRGDLGARALSIRICNFITLP
jgi:hypothetical protein